MKKIISFKFLALSLVTVLMVELTACSNVSHNERDNNTTLGNETHTFKEDVTTNITETAYTIENETEATTVVETESATIMETESATIKQTVAPTETATSEPLYNIGTGKGIGGGNIIGNCMSGKRALPIYSVKTNSNYISLSINAAWGTSDVIPMLDILDKYNLKTTFFVTGEWATLYPSMVKEIHKRGHELGSHGMNHVRMSTLSIAEQAKEINDLTTYIRNLTGYEMFLFRPPYGDYNTALVNTAYGCNYYPVQWSVDSLDWKNYGAEHLINTVTQHKNLKKGAIIQLHNGTKYTAATLETIIIKLQEKGYTIVPISQLVIKSNFRMNGAGTQIAN